MATYKLQSKTKTASKSKYCEVQGEATDTLLYETLERKDIKSIGVRELILILAS